MISKISHKIYSIINEIEMEVLCSDNSAEINWSRVQATTKACRQIESILESDFVNKYLRYRECILMEVTFNTSFEISVSHKYQGVMHTGYNPISRFLEHFFETVEWNRIVTINEIVNG